MFIPSSERRNLPGVWHNGQNYSPVLCGTAAMKM
jgi:hypothetical protein